MGESYRLIADALAADIAAGRLAAGERLPPQRDFAYARGIAVSTASRVYAELIRRGLVTGEVGRGTYVRAAPPPSSPALAEPAPVPVDLELNFSVLPQQAAELAPVLAGLLQPDALTQASRPVGVAATGAARDIAARFLARPAWMPDPDTVLFTGNGRQAIAACLAALAPPGERIGVEALTYPLVKGIAARLGITLVPLALDDQGIRPEALAEAHRAAPLRGVYLQPTLQNPLGLTMGAGRRAELAALLRQTGLIAIEDRIYAFLAEGEAPPPLSGPPLPEPPPPLAAMIPDRVILIDSLSKRIAPGLTLGFIVAPSALVDRLAIAVRSGAWAASGFPLAAGLRWMADGTAARIAAAKIIDARHRQDLAHDILTGLDLTGDRRAYHLWLALPGAWRAEAFAAAAARQGIAVTPASAFAIGAGHAPAAIRLALASPPPDRLAPALRALRRLALRDAEDASVE